MRFTNVAADRTCGECGAELPANAPEGLCPRCLAHMGVNIIAGAPRNSATAESVGTETATERIRYFGDYELLEEIARGGMGIVYRARQASLNRIVAVKVLLFGKFSSDDFVRRFKTEAQAAAALQHSNIVAIHEVGEHDGQPYFSMDYIEGKSLATLTRDNPLSAKQSAAYLKTLAEAIHYAHQRGVLHRDLKPSNVIIDLQNQPRVTDFGLAKRMEDDAEITPTGQVLGSPNYMPPEQANRKNGDVSTASDVYSLGAILYHLLTGRPPFVGETPLETLHHVLHSELVAPRLLRPKTPRDLETICLKCLEKEPARRYGSAQELADDLDRLLGGEAIRARPVSPCERFWRWCWRNPGIASVSAIALIILLAGTIVSTVLAVRAKRAEQFVRMEMAGNDKVVEFLHELLEGIPQAVAEGRDPAMMQELVDKAVARMNKELPMHHRAEANLLYNIGHIYLDLHAYARAEAIFRDIVAAEAQLHGSNHVHVAQALGLLGQLFIEQGRLQEAEAAVTSALTIAQRSAGKEPAAFEEAQTEMAGVRLKQGKFAEAETLSRQVLTARQRRLGEEHPEVLTSLNNLSAVLLNQGKLNEAEKIFQKVLLSRRKLAGTDKKDLAMSLHNLAATLAAEAKYEESMELLRQRLKICRESMGLSHPATLEASIAISSLLVNQDREAEAESILKDVVETQRKVGREKEPLTASALATLAWALEQQGKLSDAETVATRALSLQKELLGSENPHTAQSLSILASIVKKQGRPKEAETMYREALAIRSRVLGPEHLDTAKSLHSVATILRDEKQFTEADVKFHQALTIRTNVLGGDHPDVASTLYEYGGSFQDQHKFSEAEPMLLRALEIRTKLFGLENIETIECLNRLANLLAQWGRFAEAEQRSFQVVNARKKWRGPEHEDVASALERLASVQWDQNKKSGAEKTYIEALPIYRKLLKERNTNALIVLNRFAWQVLGGQNKFSEAEAFLLELLTTVKQVYGEDSAAVAERLDNFGNWLADRHRPEEAEKTFSDALERRRKLGDDHPGAADSMVQLGLFYGKQGNYADAEKLFSQALPIKTKQLGPEHREVVNLMSDLATTLDKQHKHPEAEPLLLKWSEIVQRNPDETLEKKRNAIDRLCAFYLGWSATAPGTGKNYKFLEWQKRLVEFEAASREQRKIPE